VGSALQFGVQLPVVWRLAPGIRPLLNLADANVRTTARNFGPAFFGRGVMQISSYIDSVLASLLPIGSVAIFGYAQTLYTLPVSLFGMSVSAAELPAMSSVIGSDAEVAEWLRGRLAGGLRRIAFFVIPSAAAFVLLGDTIAAGLFQSGQFDRSDSVRVWATLAGSSVGLLAQTWARLYSSTWYALKDTRTPLRIAFIRVVLTTALGWVMAVQAPVWFGIDAQWGVAGLTASAGIAGWVEYILLRRALDARIGRTGIAAGIIPRLWGAAAVAGLAGVLVKLGTSTLHPIVAATLTCGAFGATYLSVTTAMGMEEVRPILRKLRIRR
jgi:putative peptidoglycan lipid II flippase